MVSITPEHCPVFSEIKNKKDPKEMELRQRNPLEEESTHKEQHKGGASQYIKSIIYGGLDGIVSVFVTVAAVSGSDIGIGLVLVLGLAKLFAGAISMGIGDWLSTGAEVDMAKTERKREEWEVDNYVEGEIEEMVQLYVKKGVPEETARKIMRILSKHKTAFVDIMMAEELGIAPDVVNDVPWKHGVVNFGSFMTFGVVPLIVYVIVVGIRTTTTVSNNTVFGISIGITVITLLGMGLLKAFLTGSSKVKSALTTAIFGSVTAAIGWFIGFILNYTTGISIS